MYYLAIMEGFRSPEILDPVVEYRPELEPERDKCLRSLMAQVEGRTHANVSRDADQFLIEGINSSVVEADTLRGIFKLACQQNGCEADCVMVIRTSGEKGTLSVEDPESLDACLYKD